MTILNAAIEANGWVLRITLTATPGSFASYALTPDAIPKLSLVSNHPGYAPAGGTATATTLARSIIATKPLRKPVNPLSPTTPVLDETDNGDGSITVRLALSDWIHATDTGLALTMLAGWRTGEAAGTTPVGNGSTVAAAMPIMRWADVPYQRATGPFTLELTVFSHHPQGLAPVAGVRFRVTDGTTTRTAWATAQTSSTRYDDSVSVYAATIDPVAAPGLTAGLLRCDAEVYPWLGAMRSTDPAGSASMSGLNFAGYASKAEAPFVVGYDPAGTRYGGQVLFIDPAGTATAVAAMVANDLAAARAIASASRPRDITTAIQALYLANRGLAAANGGTAAVRSADGARLVLAAGNHAGVGTTTITTGASSSELGVIIEGDPDDPAPRANCVLATGTATGLKVNRLILRSLTLETGTTSLASTAQAYFWLDNVEVRGKSGQETNSVAPITAATPAAAANLAATRSRWWKSGTAFRGTTLRFGLLRNCEFSRRAEGVCILGGRLIPATEDATVTNAENGAGHWNSTSDIGAVEDSVVAGVDLRSVKGRVWVITSASAAAAGTTLPSIRRAVFANNLCERIGADPQPFFSAGEDGSAVMSYNIIEGNSFIGERCNLFYSDPVPTTVAEANGQLNVAIGNRVANNSFDWAATKHDAFNDPTTLAVRTSGGVAGPTGYRPQMVETWSITYGVGWEANHDFGRLGGGNFAFEYFGRRSVQAVGGVPGWPADRSNAGSPTTGGGSYKPPPGSVLLGRGLRASIDRDLGGTTRMVPFTVGSVESGAAVTLAPGKARSNSLAGPVALGWRGTLVAAQGRSSSRSGSAAIHWGGSLAPARGHLAQVGSAALLGLGQVTIAALSARLATRDAGTAVLPDQPFELLFGSPRLVRIAGEVRVQFVPHD
ncbi:hypothetical protein [Glacieibacterium sp.]|uniref:hypothetical protein n=1 Tax=Glacieibacterium sp. TaxID=2860237 RepID=UPI003B00484A